VLDGKERVYSNVTDTIANFKTSPSQEYFSVERSLTNIKVLPTVRKQTLYRTLLHDIAMEGSTTQSFFNFIAIYTKYISTSLHSRPPTKLILL